VILKTSIDSDWIMDGHGSSIKGSGLPYMLGGARSGGTMIEAKGEVELSGRLMPAVVKDQLPSHGCGACQPGPVVAVPPLVVLSMMSGGN